MKPKAPVLLGFWLFLAIVLLFSVVSVNSVGYFFRASWSAKKDGRKVQFAVSPQAEACGYNLPFTSLGAVTRALKA
jgi:hypothetical protein